MTKKTKIVRHSSLHHQRHSKEFATFPSRIALRLYNDRLCSQAYRILMFRITLNNILTATIFALLSSLVYIYTAEPATSIITSAKLSAAKRLLTNRHFSATAIHNKTSAAMTATSSAVPRTISKAFLAVEQSEGQGARVRRSIGTPALRNFTPFLMLDHFSIKPGAGFPDQYVFFFFFLSFCS